ncbi:MAG TPA: hypothetical protein VHA77_09540 [Xanthobacteraceae bacterium]|jgi:hypothetical protein|nr:hypothetical protein [Xanthobacteraceae bacterium]
MLKQVAAALVAASLLSVPAFAAGTSRSTAPMSTTHVKSKASHVVKSHKAKRHVAKSKRVRHGKVAAHSKRAPHVASHKHPHHAKASHLKGTKPAKTQHTARAGKSSFKTKTTTRVN